MRTCSSCICYKNLWPLHRRVVAHARFRKLVTRFELHEGLWKSMRARKRWWDLEPSKPFVLIFFKLYFYQIKGVQCINSSPKIRKLLSFTYQMLLYKKYIMIKKLFFSFICRETGKACDDTAYVLFEVKCKIRPYFPFGIVFGA